MALLHIVVRGRVSSLGGHVNRRPATIGCSFSAVLETQQQTDAVEARPGNGHSTTCVFERARHGGGRCMAASGAPLLAPDHHAVIAARGSGGGSRETRQTRFLPRCSSASGGPLPRIRDGWPPRRKSRSLLARSSDCAENDRVTRRLRGRPLPQEGTGDETGIGPSRRCVSRSFVVKRLSLRWRRGW